MMWFMNHFFNPLVRWILRSPLNGLMSKETMLITYRGRKSNKDYILPVQYVRVEQEVWISVGFAEKKHWWQNLIGGAPVRLCISGAWMNGQALVLRGESDRLEIIAGLRNMINKFPAMQKYYTDLEKTTFDVSSIVMVKVLLN